VEDDMKLWLREHAFSIASTVLVVLVIVLAAFLLRRLLILSPNDKNTTTVLAAAIALTGVLATAAVSLVGYLLRQSIDLRTARLAEQSAEAAAVEHQRLKMETAMQTVKLLTGEEGKAAPTVQVSAALLVLAKLGEVSLAIDLAAEMWPKEQLSKSAAVQLADMGLRSTDLSSQRAAAMLLRNNVGRLHVESDVGPRQYAWPDALAVWNLDLPESVRITIAATLVDWLYLASAPTANDFRWKLIETARKNDTSTGVQEIISAAGLELPTK